MMRLPLRIVTSLTLTLCWSLGIPVSAQPPAPGSNQTQAAKKTQAKPVDRSGKARKGKASYYARKFSGKTMADGTPMNPNSNVAASKTLPLGTKAKVTNLRNGKSATVEIKDRGPYVKDRIIDVTPKTAGQLDLKKEGSAPVEVKPLAIPPQDGSGSQAAAPDAARNGSKR